MSSFLQERGEDFGSIDDILNVMIRHRTNDNIDVTQFFSNLGPRSQNISTHRFHSFLEAVFPCFLIIRIHHSRTDIHTDNLARVRLEPLRDQTYVNCCVGNQGTCAASKVNDYSGGWVPLYSFCL